MSETPTAEPAGDEEALVRAHLPLARRAVAELSARMPRHASRDDLLSAAMAGLAQAARNFDGSKGVPFHRYAVTRIKGALLDELRAGDWASRPVRAKARNVELIREGLTAKLGRIPTRAEVAEEMGVEADTLRGLDQDLHRATVLNYDGLVVDGQADTVLPASNDNPELQLLERERNAYLADAIHSLPERLQTVVVGYFFENRPMQSIAEELGVTESRVSQLRAEAIDLLRDGMNSQLDPGRVPGASIPTGRAARRKQAYFDAIAASSSSAERLSAKPRLRPAAVA